MAGPKQASKSNDEAKGMQEAVKAALGTKENPIFIKHVYDESDHPVLAAPSTAGDELTGAAWAREEARCQVQNTIFNAERVAQAVLMGPHARTLLQGDPLDPTAKPGGKTQGAHLAREAYRFTKDYEREMKLILLEEIEKAEQEYTANETKNVSGEDGQATTGEDQNTEGQDQTGDGENTEGPAQAAG